jgi:hypothetical protein
MFHCIYIIIRKTNVGCGHIIVKNHTYTFSQFNLGLSWGYHHGQYLGCTHVCVCFTWCKWGYHHGQYLGCTRVCVCFTWCKWGYHHGQYLGCTRVCVCFTWCKIVSILQFQFQVADYFFKLYNLKATLLSFVTALLIKWTISDSCKIINSICIFDMGYLDEMQYLMATLKFVLNFKSKSVMHDCNFCFRSNFTKHL